MTRSKRTDGGTIFDPPYQPPVKINLLHRYETKDVVDLLRRVRDGDDEQALLNVCGVAILNLNRRQAKQACDLLVHLLTEQLSEGKAA